MKDNMATCEIWICVDTAGDYGQGKDADAAKESYEQDIQPLSSCGGFRLLKVLIQVPLPVEQDPDAEVTIDAWPAGAVKAVQS